MRAIPGAIVNETCRLRACSIQGGIGTSSDDAVSDTAGGVQRPTALAYKLGRLRFSIGEKDDEGG